MQSPALRWALAGILSYAALSRVLYLLAYRSDPFARHLIHDARRYHEWALALALGQPWDGGAFYQAPLYPYCVAAVYALIGPSPLAPLAVQLVLGVATIALVFRIAARAYGAQAGLASAAIAALYGPLVFYETKLLPASVVVFLVAAVVDRMQAADAGERDVGWLVAGLLLGLASLAGPALLLLVPLGVGWLALDGSRPTSRRLLRGAYFAAGVAILVFPVTFRNHAASGEWIPISSNGGITFYQGNNPNARGVFSTPPGFSGSIFTQREESRTQAAEQTGRPLGDGAVSAYFFSKGIDFLAADPTRAAGLLGKKLLLAISDREQPLEYNVALDENPVRWLFPIPFAIVLGLAAVRAFSSRPPARHRRAEHPILLAVIVELAVLLGFYVSGRYRLPLMPALSALAGFGVVSLVANVRARGRRALPMVLPAVLVAACSFAYVPLFQRELRDQQTAMSLLDRASTLRTAGRTDEAIEAVRRSIALDPVFTERHLYLAHLLQEAGRVEQAEAVVLEAIRRNPDSTEALFAMGVLCVEQGRFEQAASAFGEVFRRDTANQNSANNLLGVLLHLGRRDQAVEVWREMQRRGLRADPSLERRVRAETDAAD